MNEAEEIFETVRRAFAAAAPDCHVVFEIMTVENDKNYHIRFDELNIDMLWESDEYFLIGHDFVYSIWDAMKNIVRFHANDQPGWRKVLSKYPKIVDVCKTVGESSSLEELKLRLSVKGLL